MTAISPGRSRFVRFLVRRSTRASPPAAGAGRDPACSAARSGARTVILIGTILPGPCVLARPVAPVLHTPSAGRDEVVTWLSPGELPAERPRQSRPPSTAVSAFRRERRRATRRREPDRVRSLPGRRAYAPTRVCALPHPAQ